MASQQPDSPGGSKPALEQQHPPVPLPPPAPVPGPSNPKTTRDTSQPGLNP